MAGAPSTLAGVGAPAGPHGALDAPPAVAPPAANGPAAEAAALADAASAAVQAVAAASAPPAVDSGDGKDGDDGKDDGDGGGRPPDMELGPIVVTFCESLIPVAVDDAAGLLFCLLVRDRRSHASRGVLPGTFCPTVLRGVVDVATTELLVMSASASGGASLVEWLHSTPGGGLTY